MNLSLTPEVEQKIATQLNSGRYQSANEVILAALELLDQREQNLAELRQQIEVGVDQINQGKVTDGEVVFNHLLNRLQPQSNNPIQTVPLWQKATPKERSEDFRQWVKQLPQTSPSLPDTAFDRGSLYEY